MARNDDTLNFQVERNFREETFIIQSKIFYMGLPGEHLKLYLFIIHLIGDKHDTNPSINQLARYMGKSRRQIIRYIDDLEDLGLLKIKPRYTDDNHRTSNTYLLRDISTMDSLFTLDDLKREDFKLDAMIKSRIERQKEKSSNDGSDTGDTTENKGLYENDNGHPCHYGNDGSDTSGTTENMDVPPVSGTPVAHRINTLVGSIGCLSEENKNSMAEIELAQKETTVTSEEPLDEDLISVLEQFGVLDTETGKELYQIAINENATPTELEQSLKEFLIYRKKLSKTGEKVNNPFGFFVEKIRKYHKANDLLDNIKVPEKFKNEVNGVQKGSQLKKPKAGEIRKKAVQTDKYENFYL